MDSTMKLGKMLFKLDNVYLPFMFGVIVPKSVVLTLFLKSPYFCNGTKPAPSL